MYKKKILVTSGVAAFIVAVILNLSISLKSSAEFDLILANIEVLAHNEGDGSSCTPTGIYKELWFDGCLYYCVLCKDGEWLTLYLIRCVAK